MSDVSAAAAPTGLESAAVKAVSTVFSKAVSWFLLLLLLPRLCLLLRLCRR